MTAPRRSRRPEGWLQALVAAVLLLAALVSPTVAEAACVSGAPDGVLGGSEECDGALFATGYTSCTDTNVGFLGDDGTAFTCTSTCEVDTSSCTNDLDGDGEDALSAGGPDCNDGNPAINTSATEVCDGVDNDCDTAFDDADPSLDLSTATTFYADGDSDGFGDPSSPTQACVQPVNTVTDNTDCDDTVATINTSATEVCDGVDNDCDGLIDDADPGVDPSTYTTFYADTDTDGYGDPGSSTTACAAPAGFVANADDCNDAEPLAYTGATEVCDTVDNDCDGDIDDDDLGVDPASFTTFYADTDTDSYGDAASTTAACTAPATYVSDNTDCDDTDSSINPGATEVCDAADVDENCNTLSDDADSGVDTSTYTTFYRDSDSDSYGDPGTTTGACDVPSGYVSDNTDCDDTAAGVNPGETEVCDPSNTDEDCNSLADDADSGVDPTGFSTFYQDSDTDTYGDASNTTAACDPPTGYVTDSADCNDASSAINPSASEVCDSIDNDCDGDIDDADASLDTSTASEVYTDSDGDGFGDDSTLVLQCNPSTGLVFVGGDCDDGSASVNPAATEVCDGADNDCDGDIDDADSSVDLSTGTTSYSDVDGDGYGDPATALTSCTVPTSAVTVAGDCNDGDSAIRPTATEVCDGVDNDCDGDIDDDDAGLDSSTVTAYYPDGDSDGYPDDAASPVYQCDAPTGYLDLSAGADCDDTTSAVNPGATEVCDGIDNDCDGDTDDDDSSLDTTTTDTFYPDADGDGYPDLTATPAESCSAPASYISGDGLSTDCDDANALRNPGATEVCDGIDNDCDGDIDADDDSISSTTIYYSDSDGDSYGDPDSAVVSCETSPPAGLVDNDDDCDDTTTEVQPGATEVCDGRRNDCSTGTGVPTDEIDVDGDGFVECGFDGSITWQGSTTVEIGEDCGPRDPSTYPYASETCDGIYNDCENAAYSATGAPANETDDDGDTYVECFDGSTTWQSPYFTPSTGIDCDDDDTTVHPSAVELCDGQFNDCDDTDYGAQDAPNNELDDDGDGYVECRDGSVSWVGDASVSVGEDCDDTDATVYPGATETGVCDGIDTDCDGAVSWASELDEDGDGYVVCNFSAATWKGSTEVLGGLDCDDTEAAVYPDAAEVCDGRYNDCNDPFYGVQAAPDDELDDDGDTFVECRDGTVTWVGDATVSIGEDCDDTDATAFPGASPNESDPEACTRDADGDDWGDAAATEPVSAGTDCDDAAADTYPGAPELCEDDTARDNDCDGNPNTENGGALSSDAGGSIEVFWDADGDGWGDETAEPTYVCDRTELEGVYAYTSSDCDDSNPTVYPGAPEICNGFDDNCNDQIDRLSELDPDLSGCVTMYRDLDEDDYGDPDIEACVCAEEDDATGAYDGDDRYVIFAQDCDDTDSNTHPLSCSDGIDNDPAAADGTDADDPDCAAGLNEQGTEVEKAYEFIDGNDNDCDGRIAAVELDCDDDGSFALLPEQRSAILDAGEAGLESCGDDGTTRTLTCWDSPELQLECDGPTGLWMFRYADASADVVGDRFDSGRRLWTGSRPCSTLGDCDDQCASRCPDLDEACDGIDNDCSATDLATQGSSDIAGLPDSMFSLREVAGTVPAAEQDIDQDGFLACDDFTASAAQVLTTAASCDDIVSDTALLTDCEQRCSLSFPGAEERCNGFLDDCDGDVEGVDSDFDGYRSCGAWSAGGQDEMPEDIVVVVWVAPAEASVRDTGTAAGGGTDTAGADTATAASIEWDGASAYVPLVLPRTLSLSVDDRAHRQLWEERRADGDLGFECADGSVDGNRRRVLYTCDQELYDALATLVGDAALQDAICQEDGAALLSPCDSATGECGLVSVTLDATVDADLWTRDVPAAELTADCEARPEELISRGVWPASRILSARDAVVLFECRRLYGTDCESITASTPLVATWDSLPDASDALASDPSWWKELDRFALEPLTSGTVGWCWGDPTDGLDSIGQRTGGDCSDSASKSHRDAAEGPGDLMGLLDPDGAADCSTCVDGIDNNCDGQIDCADPACAACFVGQGVGCGGSDQAQCAGAGCATAGQATPPARGSRPGRLAVILFSALAVSLVRRRERP